MEGVEGSGKWRVWGGVRHIEDVGRGQPNGGFMEGVKQMEGS